MLGGVVISARDWFWVAGLFLAGFVALLAWGYRHGPLESGVRRACVALRILGVLSLLGCLLEPMATRSRARPGANLLAILADNSAGMQVRDRAESLTRAEVQARLLADGPGGWGDALEENFQVRRYFFDARLHSTRDYGDLTFDGRASALATSLRSLADRFRGQPLAGVLLLTDGNATDAPQGLMDPTGLPPVYPVVIGQDEPIRDLAVRSTTVSLAAFEDAPVTIHAEVAAGGYAGSLLRARLADQDGQAVAEQTQRIPSGDATVNLRFQVRPTRPGVQFYRLRVGAAEEWEQFSAPATTTEATLVNNDRLVAVDRGAGPHRILYVAGRPNWEFKFLNRALAEDDQLRLVALIRVARREPKFTFRGRVGESSNPLFRGFSNQAPEEIERYDQPVLVRLGTRDAEELAGGFPKTAEELYPYRAVIVDDLEAEFFTRDQLTLLQKYVSERGGALLMLGGVGSYQDGGYGRTPVGDLLPVYLTTPTPAAPPASGLQLRFTREGWLQPWLRLRGTEKEENSRLGTTSPFHVMNQVRGTKPGASVLAVVEDGAGKSHPALVTQRFGHGRVGAWLLGDLWRAGLQNETARTDQDKAWRQLARWLVADVPDRVQLDAQRSPEGAGQAIRLEARARDPKFQALLNATATVQVRFLGVPGSTSGPPAQVHQPIQLTLEGSLTEPGLYEANYFPRETGAYVAEATVVDADGRTAGTATVGWVADPVADEFRSTRPNRAWLEALARQTGGQVVAPESLARWARNLPLRAAPITETWTFPLWHQPLVLLFALGCFTAEWGLRRWKGAA